MGWGRYCCQEAIALVQVNNGIGDGEEKPQSVDTAGIDSHSLVNQMQYVDDGKKKPTTGYQDNSKFSRLYF